MCLRLQTAELLRWKRDASKMISKAISAAAKMTPDPLFASDPNFSALVSAADSIKKRHGHLIERALIDAINKVPGWRALRGETLPTKGTKQRQIDCLAFNTGTSTVYVFECKRGHGDPDADRITAIDGRLDEVISAMPAFCTAKGWGAPKVTALLLSFYGKQWSSRYPIYDMKTVNTVFPACATYLTREFMRHTENEVAERYSREEAASAGLSRRERTLFDDIGESFPAGSEIVVGADGWQIESPA